MTTTTFDDSMTMLEARTRYFEVNHFGSDGGYGDEWVTVQAFGTNLRFPNTPSRVRAVRYHDLHHVLTGYPTDMHGETEISAWELASGCRNMVAAWLLNAGGMAYGLMVCPVRVRQAFFRGRHSRNLYDRPFDDLLLGRHVGELRTELGLDARSIQPTLADRLWFALAVLALFTMVAALLSVFVVPVLMLLGWLG